MAQCKPTASITRQPPPSIKRVRSEGAQLQAEVQVVVTEPGWLRLLMSCVTEEINGTTYHHPDGLMDGPKPKGCTVLYQSLKENGDTSGTSMEHGVVTKTIKVYHSGTIICRFDDLRIASCRMDDAERMLQRRNTYLGGVERWQIYVAHNTRSEVTRRLAFLIEWRSLNEAGGQESLDLQRLFSNPITNCYSEEKKRGSKRQADYAKDRKPKDVKVVPGLDYNSHFPFSTGSHCIERHVEPSQQGYSSTISAITSPPTYTPPSNVQFQNAAMNGGYTIGSHGMTTLTQPHGFAPMQSSYHFPGSTPMPTQTFEVLKASDNVSNASQFPLYNQPYGPETSYTRASPQDEISAINNHSESVNRSRHLESLLPSRQVVGWRPEMDQSTAIDQAEPETQPESARYTPLDGSVSHGSRQHDRI